MGVARQFAIILAGLALIAPARADIGDPRKVELSALPTVVAAGEPAAWVVTVRGPWADAAVDVLIPALLDGATIATVPDGIACQRVDSPVALYAVRCDVKTAPATLTIRGRVIVAPGSFCAVAVVSERDYMTVDQDCQIVTGLERVYAPLVVR